MTKKRQIPLEINLEGIDKTNQGLQQLNDTVMQTQDSINKLNQDSISLIDRALEKVEEKAREVMEDEEKQKELGKKGVEAFVNWLKKKFVRYLIGRRDPIGTVETVLNAPAYYQKYKDDQKREYKSVIDDTEHSSLESLKKYNEDYINSEKERINTLIGYEKELAQKRLEVLEQWVADRNKVYEGRNAVEDVYFEENLMDTYGNLVKQPLGIFPMSSEERDDKLEKVNKYREKSDKVRGNALGKIDGQIENYKASNAPEIVIEAPAPKSGNPQEKIKSHTNDNNYWSTDDYFGDRRPNFQGGYSPEQLAEQDRKDAEARKKREKEQQEAERKAKKAHLDKLMQDANNRRDEEIQRELDNKEIQENIQKELTESEQEQNQKRVENFKDSLEQKEEASSEYNGDQQSLREALPFMSFPGFAPVNNFVAPSTATAPINGSENQVQEQEEVVGRLNTLYQEDAGNLMAANAEKGNVLQQFLGMMRNQPEELKTIFGTVENLVGVDLGKFTKFLDIKKVNYLYS